MKRLFHESLYDFGTPQPSWWEKSAIYGPNLNLLPLSGDEVFDCAIIGGGYTGLSAAYYLAKEFNVSACVLEAGHIGWGASGRNGGFCCMGGTLYGTDSMVRKFGIDETRKYFSVQAEAVELVKSLIEEEVVDAELQGDGEMAVAESKRHFDVLSEEADFLKNHLGVDARSINQHEFAERCYDATHQHGALVTKPGFGLHPLNFCQGLALSAQRNNATLYPQSEVIRWEREGAKHKLFTRTGSVRANHVIVACNGFMPEHLSASFAGRTMPLQSQIIVTRPLNKEEIDAHNWRSETPAINSRNVYFYYRMLPDNRFLIGGRADFRGTPHGAERTAAKLHRDMTNLWPHWENVSIEYSWRGFVCFTSKFSPSIGRLTDDPSVYYGFGYHGNGVNNATWAGREIARWMNSSNTKTSPLPTHLPAPMQGMSSAFPFPSLRNRYAQLGVAWHKLKDTMGI